MIIKQEIEIHPKSEKFLDIDSMYEKTDKLELAKKVIIHLYPDRDTMDKDGNLTGFVDKLFFKCKIYNLDNMTVFETENKDGIDFGFDFPHSIQTAIYKDGSTCITITAIGDRFIDIALGQFIIIG